MAEEKLYAVPGLRAGTAMVCAARMLHAAEIRRYYQTA
jgi:hypothetical protein